jgi:hypothetical protein
MTWQLYQAAILILLQITNGSHSFGLHHLSDSLNLINTDFPPRGTFFFLWKFATKPMAHRKVLPPTSFGLSGFRSVIIFVSAKSSLSYYLFRSLQRVALPSRLARRPALCLSATWPLRSATPSLRSPAMDDPKVLITNTFTFFHFLSLSFTKFLILGLKLLNFPNSRIITFLL